MNERNRETFYTVGGTLSKESIYVKRAADELLLKATLAGEFCNVLTPRQLGKSSLMVRTAERLEAAGVHTAMIDLTDLGTALQADNWYYGLLSRLAKQLNLAVSVREWWEDREQLGAVQRFSDFISDVILEERAGKVVVFVDEIDSTLGMPFTDDFFAVIRAIYNARARDASLKRIAFVLLGVARPSELIKDRSRTPYNIGVSIDLTDFSEAEASILLPGLSAGVNEATRMMRRILYWTSGHPYLTQRVCFELTKNADLEGKLDEEIDAAVRRVFLTDESRKESNLQYISDRIQESRDRDKLLSIYRKVRAGKQVHDQERDPICSQLKLTGLVVPDKNGILQVRNRIYEAAFDLDWVRSSMPLVTPRRIIIAASLIILASILVGTYLLVQRQNNDDIRTQVLAETFTGTASVAVRLNTLATLFEMDGNAVREAQRLFLALSPADQQSLFAVSLENEAHEDLLLVISETHALLPDDTENNATLLAMLQGLEGLRSSFPDSAILGVEIRTSLEGRERYADDNLQGALRAFDRVLEINPDNAGALIDRAAVRADLGDYEEALLDLNQALAISGEIESSIAALLARNDVLNQYLAENADRFPALPG